MNSLRFILCGVIICFGAHLGYAQFRISGSVKSYTFNTETSPKQSWLASQSQNIFQPPILSALGASTFNPRSIYWLSQVTTQTIKTGKMGTYYLWDQQGNLRESRFFLDIGGKKKSGLKLVFPRR